MDSLVDPVHRPPASLVICSRNRPQLLLETIASVMLGSEGPTEIVVVDQSDHVNQALAGLSCDPAYPIHYLWKPGRGSSRARNTGIIAASNDFLVFIDDDMLVEKDWFESLVRATLQNGSKAVITGRVLPGNVEKSGGFVPALAESSEPRVFHGRINTDVLAAGHMAMYRSTIESVGSFDERLGAGSRFAAAEDNDYGFRLLEAGFRIVYWPQAVIYHRAWRSNKDYFPMRWSYGRGKGGFYAKYSSREDAFMFWRMCKDLSLRFIRFPWRVLHRPRLAFGDLVYACSVLSAFIEWRLTQ